MSRPARPELNIEQMRRISNRFTGIENGLTTLALEIKNLATCVSEFEKRLDGHRDAKQNTIGIFNNQLGITDKHNHPWAGISDDPYDADSEEEIYPDDEQYLFRNHREQLNERASPRRSSMDNNRYMRLSGDDEEFEGGASTNRTAYESTLEVAVDDDFEEHVHFQTWQSDEESEHVHWENGQRWTGTDNRFGEKSQNLPSKDLPFEMCTEIISQLSKVSIPRLLPNGQIIDEQIFVNEDEFRKLAQETNASSVSQEGLLRSVSEGTRERAHHSMSHTPTISFDGNDLSASSYYSKSREILAILGKDVWSIVFSDTDDQDDYRSKSTIHTRHEKQYDQLHSEENLSTHTGQNYRPSLTKSCQEINSWKVLSPEIGKNSEQFRVIPKEQLTSSGTETVPFISSLLNIFMGSCRSLYPRSKLSWHKWRDFVQVFQCQLRAIQKKKPALT